MSWASVDLKSFYHHYSFNISAVNSSCRLMGFCGISAELWCWEPKQVENLNFLPARFSLVLFYVWSSCLRMCFCVRDRQRCSGPFSYVTVEMGFFKAFPTFLSDGWMYPGSREQCCMRCFSCIPVNPATLLSPYLSFVLSHMPALVPALFSTSSSPIFLAFINQSCRLFHHQPETVGYTSKSFRNVTTCSVFVIR